MDIYLTLIILDIDGCRKFIEKLRLMGLLDFMLGIKRNKIKSYLNRGAIILDVREKDEYENGHIKAAYNIPLSQLNNELGQIKAFNKPIIVHCEHGARSAKAVKFLRLKNIEAINGGGYKYLKKLLQLN